MSIIKNTNRNKLIFIVIVVLSATLIISYMNYLKSKVTQVFYNNTYNKAFEQMEIVSEFINTILENKNSITSQEILSNLSNIHNSLNTASESFQLISSRLLSNKSSTDSNFMRDLIQLYDGEIARLQNELLKNQLQEDFDNIKDELFIRLALMNSDMQRITAIDTSQLTDYTYDEVKHIWVKLTTTLEYREVTIAYKLKYPDFYSKGYFFPYKK